MLCCNNIISAQIQNKAVAPPVTQNSFCTTPANFDAQNMTTLNNSMANSFIDMSFVSVCVRVYFHVIRKTDSTGGQSVASVNQAFNVLINDYYNRDITFSWNGTIDYINNTSLYNSPNSSVFAINDHYDGVDIYLFSDSGPAGGLANGVGTASGFYVGGSYWNAPFGSLPLSHVISHEMGHVLGLWHTHHGTYPEGGNDNPCPELVNGNNSATCGDYVTDTSADPHIQFNVNSSCAWLGSGFDANGQAYNPKTNNIMAYTSPSCMSLFTPKQGKRMKAALINLPYLQACSRYSYGVVDNTIPPHACTFPAPIISVYPNPADNNLKFEIDKENFEIEFKLYNSNFETVLNGMLNNGNTKISTDNLKNGNYYLHLYVNGELIIKTIIINHKN